MALPNCPEQVVTWFALHWIGAEIVSANPLFSGSDLVRVAKRTRARVVIALDLRIAPVLELTQRFPMSVLIVASLAAHLPIHLRWPYRIKQQFGNRIRAAGDTRVYDFDVLFDQLESPVPEPLLNDSDLPAILQPTGGTTGIPKIAVLTHQNLVANVSQLHVWSGLLPGTEVVLAVLPFFHVFGATVALLSSIAGGATLLLQARFDPSTVWKTMEKWQPTVAPMVPFMFASLCKEMRRRRKNIRGLRFCLAGAAPLDPEVCAEFQERTGATIIEGYGLSEASPVTHANPPEASRAGTIGLPLPDTLAKVVDLETGEKTLPPGQIGELVIRGP
jgi:long-chain acyl-CoA synthetase